jgi:large subunit ribosomal protein L4
MYNLAGEEVEKIDLDETIFGVTPNMAVIQQAVLRQQANARQGTHETLTRAQVRGGGRKPWRQKGTGRARQGSTRSPQWTHGGVVFGPHVRSYEQDMPRKMRRLAIRGVLSAKLAAGRLVIVDGFDEFEPRTKTMRDTLGKLNVGDESALIMIPEAHDNLKRAAGNLPRVTLMHASLLSVVDMLKHEFVIMPRASIEIVQGILGNGGGRRKFSLRRDGQAVSSNGTEASAEAPAKAPKTAKAKADKVEEADKPKTKAKAKAAPAGAAKKEKAAPAEVEASTAKKKAPRKAKAAAESETENVAFEPTASVAKTAGETSTDDNTEKGGEQ